jgi:L-aspartate oxidase
MTTTIGEQTFRSFSGSEGGLGTGDIVVVGAGLAGLFTALKLAPLPVTVIAAAPLGQEASSVWAQGGIAAAMGESDSPSSHARDTINAGAGLVDRSIAAAVAEEGPDRIGDLLDYGVPFDRDTEGRLLLSREGAHSLHRVVRVSGDRSGAAVMKAIIGAVAATPTIRVLDHREADGLIVEGGRVTGVRLIEAAERGNGTFDFLPASAVVLATGGVGALYSVTTNPAYARGEAMAFAARAGAVIADAEFVQFHPTAIAVGTDPAPLATESLRGEGATLINRAGHRFMMDVHADAELAPRDIVARAVFAEIGAGRGAFLDCREAIGERFESAFPTVHMLCKNAGLDPARDLIPVAPAAHYHMGGIATDGRGRTSVRGLWAAGEVASTGLHGANRLASNSLLEAIVFGARIGADIKTLVAPENVQPIAKTHRISEGRTIDPGLRDRLVARLRKAMTDHVGVVRTAAGLEHALAVAREIEAEGQDSRVIANMALAAQLIAGSALRRRESRGAHFRSDFPEARPDLGQRRFITLKTIEAMTRPVPVSEAVNCNFAGLAT